MEPACHGACHGAHHGANHGTRHGAPPQSPPLSSSHSYLYLSPLPATLYSALCPLPPSPVPGRLACLFSSTLPTLTFLSSLSPHSSPSPLFAKQDQTQSGAKAATQQGNQQGRGSSTPGGAADQLGQLSGSNRRSRTAVAAAQLHSRTAAQQSQPHSSRSRTAEQPHSRTAAQQSQPSQPSQPHSSHSRRSRRSRTAEQPHNSHSNTEGAATQRRRPHSGDSHTAGIATQWGQNTAETVGRQGQDTGTAIATSGH